jgi:multiple sugar transport system ATP-binding protein
MIYVTHDQVEAMTLADKIVVLRAGEVMQIGSPMELYHKPANLFVAGFLGSPSMNFLDVTVQDADADTAKVTSPSLDPVVVPARFGPFRKGDKLKLGIRPQYLTPTATPSDGQLHGRVALSERLGAETVIEIILRDGTRVIAALPRDAVFAPGEEVGLVFNSAESHLFRE